MGVVIAIGLVLAACVVVAGQVARVRLRLRHRPPGRYVEVGGHRFHVDVRGAGPTVILEGGTWAGAASWAVVRDGLARFATVVTYDRAGLGWSDPSPRPRTADVMADELGELLARARIPGPYVLVGHSFGGLVVRVFAHRHPRDVAAIVMLDASHEDQFLRGPAQVRAFAEQMSRRMPVMFAVLGALVRAGIVALRPSLVPAIGPLPPDALEAVRAAVATDAKVVRAMAAELALLHVGNEAVRALHIRSLGHVPLRVLSHGRPEGSPPQLGPAVAAEYERVWQELQEELAASSTRGRRTIATGVGHNIPFEAPGLVVDTVRDLLLETAESMEAALATA